MSNPSNTAILQAQSTPAADSPVNAAVHADGFVDFYELLGLPGNAPAELIGERVNDLYLNAQQNREHRHVEKRRDADFMIELLPHAVNVLTNPDNRARYDAYAASARAGTASVDFDTFMNSSIRGTKDASERKAGLGIRTQPVAAVAPPEPQAARAVPHQMSHADSTRPAREMIATQRPGVGVPLGLAVLTFVLGDAVLHASPFVSIAASVLVGGIIWKALDARWRAGQKRQV